MSLSGTSVLSVKEQVRGAFIQGRMYTILGGCDENFKKLKELIASDKKGYILYPSLEALIDETYEFMAKEENKISKRKLGELYDFLSAYS